MPGVRGGQIPDVGYQIPDVRYQIPDVRYQIRCQKLLWKEDKLP